MSVASSLQTSESNLALSGNVVTWLEEKFVKNVFVWRIDNVFVWRIAKNAGLKEFREYLNSFDTNHI